MGAKKRSSRQPTEPVVARDRRRVGEDEMREAECAVDAVGASPTDVQVCFLEGLVGHPAEAAKFLEDPQQYALEHGVILDPRLVRDIVATVVLGEDADLLRDRLSPGALRDVLSLRDRAHQGVMDGAATVTAASMGAVLSAAQSATDLQRAKGLSSAGVRLPGGRTLTLPADLNAVVVASHAVVAVYGTTTVSVLSASGGRRPGGVR